MSKSKIGIFNLPRNVQNKMSLMVEKSKETGIEYGFNMCIDRIDPILDIKTADTCIGTDCTINMDKKPCTRNQDKIGTFHTHPDDEYGSYNINDMYLWYERNEVGCIGGTNQITCYIPKHRKNCTTDIKDLYTSYLKGERVTGELDFDLLIRSTKTEERCFDEKIFKLIK